MNLLDFQPGMDRLVKLFKPFEWDEEREGEYYRIFQLWPAEKWQRAIDKVMMTSKRMPTPAHISEAVEGEYKKSAKPNQLLDEKGCPQCRRGMVYIEVNAANGQTYERYLACDCEAGDKVATHMLQLAKNRGGVISKSEVRYSFAFGDQAPKNTNHVAVF